MGVVSVLLWASLSGAVIMHNKWILVFYNFPFPVTLTMWHMGFSSVLATLCVKTGWVPAEKKMTSEVYVLPIAVLFAGEHSRSLSSQAQLLKAIHGVGCSLTTSERCMKPLQPSEPTCLHYLKAHMVAPV